MTDHHDYQISDLTFSVEDVETIVKTSIESSVQSAVYNSKKVNDWADTIIASVLKGLQDFNKPYKYVATCIIMQKTGAGLCTASTQYWDGATDGMCKVPWQNSNMHVIVTVYGVAIHTLSEMEER